MRIMITGGGTGGHTSPALAIIEELRQRDPRLMLQWVGRAKGLEEHICRGQGIPFRAAPVAPWPRGRTWRKVWAGFRLALGCLKCAALIHRFAPEAVFGVGGYVSLPLVLTAQRMGIPTFIHEQNKRLGMANQLAAARAARIYLSYPDTKGEYPEDRARVTGNPVRPAFLTPPDTASARKAFGFDPNVPTVLVCGGSQGARRLNQAVAELAPRIAPGELQLIWMTGKSGLAEARELARALAADGPAPIQVFGFIDDMVTACAAADLVVSRAGASTTAELAVLGKPAILAPYPHATDNHQEDNARAFESAGAARVLLDADCTGERLLTLIRDILGNPAARSEMGKAARSMGKPGAAESIVEDMFASLFEEITPAEDEGEGA